MTKKYNYTKKTGRPTKYKPEYATDGYIDKYISHCEENNELVSLCGFACYIGVCEDTIQEWRKVHHKFSEPLSYLKQMSKQMLLNKGLLGEYNPTIAKLGLMANHGMKERLDQTSGDEIIKSEVLFKDVLKVANDLESAGNGIDIKSIEGNGSSDQTTTR